MPIATVPGNSVNEATSIAITAIDKAGTNIFKPNFWAFISVKVVSNCFKVPTLICLVADKIAITITRHPTNTEGSILANININANIPQNRAVPILVLWFITP